MTHIHDGIRRGTRRDNADWSGRGGVGYRQWSRIRRCVPQPKRDICTYYIRGIAVLDFQEVHRPDHRLHRHENVLVHEFDEPSLILVRVAGAMDDPHLLNESGLAGLASTCDKVSGSISLLYERKPRVYPHIPFICICLRRSLSGLR